MKPKQLHTRWKRWKQRWITLAALAVSAAGALAQSSDAIIDKLVEKGILTVKEANELREETDRNFTHAYSVKSGLPDWLTSLKFGGDFRGRIEGFYSDATFLDTVGGTTNQFVDRNRFRYRLRFGVTATMFDNLETGFRLSSGEPVSGFGTSTGNPLSGNSTMQDNGSRKFIYIDTAYGRWYPLNGPDWTGVLTVGKMEQPFVFDEMVFDPDYNPEGAALQLGYRVNDHHSLKLYGGGFVLDEVSLSSNDPYLLGAQLRWDANWSTKWMSSFGGAILSVESAHMLANGAVPNVNRGNTRNADQTPTYGFNPWVVDGSLTYVADTFPLYKGTFPIKVGGMYIYNPAAPYSADNYGWTAGVTLGKSGRRGTWELAYNYRWRGANSWYEELVDDDFGAFYSEVNAPPNSGLGIGYGGGTNVKGHVFRFAYAATDSVTLSVRWYLADLIHAFPEGSDSQMSHMLVDAVWKF